MGLSNFKRLHNVLPTENKKIYNAMILPCLKYCFIVWQDCSVELRSKLEEYKNHRMRRILSQPPLASSEALRRQLEF